MKKLIYILLSSACMLSACSDDTIEKGEAPIQVNPDSVSAELREAVPSVEILTCGETDSIWAGTDKTLEFNLYVVTTEDDADAFEYRTLHGSTIYLKPSSDITFSQNGDYILTSLVPDDAAAVYVLCVNAKGEDEWYPVILTVRDGMLSTTADDDNSTTATATTDDEARSLRAASFLSHPILIDTIAAVDGSVTWLNKNSLVYGTKRTVKSKSLKVPGIMNNTKETQTWRTECKGNNTDRRDSTWSEEIGITCKIPIVGPFITNAFSKKRKTSGTTETAREWYKWTVRGIGMTASIDQTELKLNPSFYLNEGLNDVLNGKGNPKITSIYPLTAEGAMKIIDNYGLFLSTTGTFGAYSSYKYEQQANVSSVSVETAAKASVAAKYFNPSSTSKSLEAGLFYFINTHFGVDATEWNAAFNLACASSQDEYHQAVKATTSTIAFGGNCLSESDMTKWIPTDNPDNWNLVYFNTTGHPDDTGRNMVSILDLVEDTTSQRYLTLKAVLTGSTGLYAADCPYAKYLESKMEPEPLDRTIVADIIAVSGSSGYADQPKAIVMEDLKGKKRLYRPFIVNQNAGNYSNGMAGFYCREGYGFLVGRQNNNCSAFLGKLKDDAKYTYTIYYAMDDWKNCSGISDVAVVLPGFVSTAASAGFIRRGCPVGDVINDNYCQDALIYVKYVPAKDAGYDYPYVTGVGLVAGYDSGCKGGVAVNGWKVGWPMASTVGTEWTPTTRVAYNAFWNPETADSLYTCLPCNEKNAVYTFGVTANSLAKSGSTMAPVTLYGKSTVFSYYNLTSSVLGDLGMQQNYSLFPALFNESNINNSSTCACIFINYTTKRLENSYRILTPARTAKVW